MNRIFFVLALVLVSPFRTWSQAPFYQDKTVRIIAGYGAGSVDDAWTRMIARYLGKYIPGNPNIIVQNMPGAGAMIAANYVYKVAKPDGLTLGGLRAGLYFDQLVGKKEVQFDWPKFTWLGTPTQSRTTHLHPCQHAVQNDSRRAKSSRATEMRRHRDGVDRLLLPAIYWRKPSARSSIPSPATKTALKSSWRSSAKRSIAAASPSKPCSDASRSSAGSRTVLSAY